MPSYTIRGVNVRFPFDAYPCQLVYMEKVIQSLQEGKNALLESPTGTGKTLCLVCSSLAWRQHHIETEVDRLTELHENGELEFTKEELNAADSMSVTQLIYKKVLKDAPKLIYASRTHSQLSQVMDELKNCPYSPKASVLGSRKQLCINPQVLSKPSTVQNKECNKLVVSHKCNYHSKVQNMKNHSDFVDEPLAIEDLVRVGKEHKCCPFYISKELQNDADIILLPYNYLIDPIARKTLKVSLTGSILIFDEAHNLESVCAEAASFQLTTVSLNRCIEQIETCIQLGNESPLTLEANDLRKEDLVFLKDVLIQLVELIMNEPFPPSERGSTKGGEYILELFATAGLNSHENIELFCGTIELTVTFFSSQMGNSSNSSTFQMEQLSNSISLLYKDLDTACISKFYKVYIEEFQEYSNQNNKFFNSKKKKDPGRALNLWCFNSGVAMKELNSSGLRSLILTSGTLSPLDSFAFELQTEFPIQLENPHVIDGSQIWVGVSSCGPSGHAVNTSFQHRNKDTYIQELGNSIVNFTRIVPAGLLVFFSSYSIMDQYIEAWKRSTNNKVTIWERITQYKKPVLEPREGNFLNEMIDDFYKKINDPEEKGAVFFAVCRGKVSEGLDFANDNGRAVIVTGIPFPAATDQRVKLKQLYLDSPDAKVLLKSGSVGNKPKTLTGNEWYKQQASRAVNQAIGRVIRHRKDYGAIILCDERFGAPQNRAQLSAWLRPHTKVYTKFGEVTLGLTRFFKYAEANFPPPPKRETKEEQLGLVSVNRNEPKIAVGTTKRKKFVPPRPLTGEKRKLNDVLDNSYSNLANSLTNPKKAASVKSEEEESEGKNPVAETASQTQKKREKAKTAVEFIQQAKKTLSQEEYKTFQSLLRKYKQKVSTITELANEIILLFSSDDEKQQLLHGFSTFVPEKYKEVYQQQINSFFEQQTESNSIVKEEIQVISLEEEEDSEMGRPVIIEDESAPIFIVEEVNTVASPSAKNMVKAEIVEKKIVTKTTVVPSPASNKKASKSKFAYDLVTGAPIKRMKTSSGSSIENAPAANLSENSTGSFPSSSLSQLENEKEEEAEKGCKCSICQESPSAPFSSRCGHICCFTCWTDWLKVQLTCPVCRSRVREKQLTKLFFS